MSACPCKIPRSLEHNSCKQQQTGGADKLSNLPDDILHRILSSLDVKFMARTSVLSKRWRSVWTSVPYLNFSFNRLPCPPHHNHLFGNPPRRERDFDDYTTTPQYLDFEQRVLLAPTSTSQQIHKFSLSLETDICCTIRLYDYVDAAVKNRVPEIYLSLPLPFFPFRVFYQGQYIRVLKVQARFNNPHQHLNDPELVLFALPNLEYLHLESVRVHVGYSPTANLVGYCDRLKTLVLQNVDIASHSSMLAENHLLISSTSLQSLVLETRILPLACNITISTPNLLFLKFCVDVYKYKFEKDLIAPVNIQFEAIMRSNGPKDCAQVINSIQSFNTVKNLRLGYQSIQVIWEAARIKATDLWFPPLRDVTSSKPLSIFLPNVRSLKLELLPYKKGTNSIVYLLHNAPTVATLVLKTLPKQADSSKSIKAALWLKDNFSNAVMKAKLPRFRSNLEHLKKVEIINFLGCEEEFRLLKLLLKTASSLDAIVLTLQEKYSVEQENMKTTINQVLKKLPRASSRISVSFSFSSQ